jgi:hypothetical protein
MSLFCCFAAGLEAAAWAVTTTAYRLRSTDNLAVVLMGPYAATPRDDASTAASAAAATALAASASSPPESSLMAGQLVGDAPKYELHEWLVELGLGREPMPPPHLHRSADASQVRENEPCFPVSVRAAAAHAVFGPSRSAQRSEPRSARKRAVAGRDRSTRGLAHSPEEIQRGETQMRALEEASLGRLPATLSHRSSRSIGGGGGGRSDGSTADSEELWSALAPLGLFPRLDRSAVGECALQLPSDVALREVRE